MAAYVCRCRGKERPDARGDEWNTPRRCTGATTVRSISPLLRAVLQAARRRLRCWVCRLPVRPLSRPDLRRHGAVRRHLGLRARDDPRRGQGRGVQLLRPPRHPHPVHGDARRHRRATGPGSRAAALSRRLQRRRISADAQEIHDLVLAAFREPSWAAVEPTAGNLVRGPRGRHAGAARLAFAPPPLAAAPSTSTSSNIRTHYQS